MAAPRQAVFPGARALEGLAAFDEPLAEEPCEPSLMLGQLHACGAPPIRVVIGAEAHATVFKALAFLGLGRDRVERVPVDGQGRMLASAMPELDERTLVVAQAGNVNTGSLTRCWWPARRRNRPSRR
jgi:hypothetical protein